MKNTFKLFALLLVAIFTVACTEEPQPTAENLVNVMWRPNVVSSSTINAIPPFCLLENGSLMIAGTNPKNYNSWSINPESEPNLTISNSSGETLGVSAKFRLDGSVALSFSETSTYTSTPLQLIQAGERYKVASWRQIGKWSVPEEEVYLFFDYENSLRGFAGVNNFWGNYQLTGYLTIDISDIATTRRSGKYNEFEKEFISELANNITSYIINMNTIYLYDNSELAIILQKSRLEN